MDSTPRNKLSVSNDPYCLAQLKHYHSLIQLGMEAYKPIFALKPADGAFGGHLYAAQHSYTEFKMLSDAIMDKIGDGIDIGPRNGRR